MKIKIFLLLFIFSVAGFSQVVIKNDIDEPLVTIDPEANMTVKSLANDTGSISLVGATSQGTLVKANTDLLQQALIFFPQSALIDELYIAGLAGTNVEDTLGTYALQSLPNLDIPDEATHILLSVETDCNIRGYTTAYINAKATLYIDSEGGAEHLNNPIYETVNLDGSAQSSWSDTEQQNSRTKVVPLSSQKSFSYYLRFSAATNGNWSTVGYRYFNGSLTSFRLEGYYVPLATILQQTP